LLSMGDGLRMVIFSYTKKLTLPLNNFLFTVNSTELMLSYFSKNFKLEGSVLWVHLKEKSQLWE
jgi:hypothetical protein